MRKLVVILPMMMMCSCVTMEEQVVQAPVPQRKSRVTAESGRGIPYFRRYERGSVKPSPGRAPRLVEPNNCLPTFHDYEKVIPAKRDTGPRR
jgi:hypothetical protein